MTNRFYIFLVSILIVALPFFSYSTHIVGGALTYEYKGGSTYVVTLKLYRDCSANTFAMPTSVNISVLGYNGATFPTSKDFTMNITGSVTPVPANLDSCAQPPNPMPCVEQGIFTKTVTNLPPNPGGYHLYYQVRARNTTLSNINSSCNCIGESFYAYIPGQSVNWYENFTLANGTTSDAGTTAWSVTSGTIAPNYARVNNNLFEVSGANSAQVTWLSQIINISTLIAGANVNIDLYETGNLQANDSILIYYSLDGGAFTPFTTNGFFANDFGSALSSVSGLIGNTLQIMIRVHYDNSSPNTEIYQFDNVDVYGTDFIADDDPVFTLFPPLFLCAGEPFSFDHSATDADGDSLVYSFYNPYDGYTGGATPVAPTFSANVAYFTPIIYNGGYSYTNPLGGTPLNLNSSTGLLTGTPASIGQYVVGVKVKEYRNGIYIGETLRDFQFNVVVCPPDAEAVLSPISVCVGTTYTFGNEDPNATVWWWDFGNSASTTDTSIAEFPTYVYPSVGNYTVTLIVNKWTSCADTARTPVYVGFVTPSFTHNAPKCAGGVITFTDTSTKSANATITSWSWNFGDGSTATTQNPTHAYATAGTYTVVLTLTTSIGCTGTARQSFTINAQPTVNAISNQTVCGNNSAVALTGTVTIASGIIWTTNGTGTFTPSSTTINATYNPSTADTAAGAVTFTLTTTGNGVCNAASDYLTVTITNAPGANAGVDISVCASILTVTLNGSVSVATGGTWTSSGTGTFTPGANTLNATYNPSVADVAVGTLTLTLTTTGNGLCNPVSDAVKVTITPDNISVNAGNDTAVCSSSILLHGTVTTATGGTWSILSGSGTFTPNVNTLNATYTFSTADTIANIVKLVLTTTGNGACAAKKDTITITIPKYIAVGVIASGTVCANGTPVSLNVNVTTGQGVWSTTGSGIFSPNTTTLTPTYLPSAADILAGSVNIIFTSGNNGICAPTKDTVPISLLPAPSLTLTSTAVSCFSGNNGTAFVAASGGVSPYFYQWNNNATTSSVNGLTSGTYTVNVIDNKSCNRRASISITQPSVAVTVTVSASSNVSCSGGSNGSITVAASGGTAPYNYNWHPASGTKTNVTGLMAGSYTVTVTDNNGCNIKGSHTITEPALLIITSITSVSVSCNAASNGSATVVPGGGTLPYKYLWSNGKTISTINNLGTGTYTVTIMDNNSCSAIGSVFVNQATALTTTVSSTPAHCGQSDGTATVAAFGGTGSYIYLWNNGQTRQTATYLTSANYQVTVTDVNGCTASNTIQVANNPGVTAQAVSTTSVLCFNMCTGAATIGGTGGILPYTFRWNTGATSNSINSLCASLYTATVTDATGCTSSTAFNIQEPALLTVTITATNVSCFEGSNGSAIANINGGTTPYTYEWNTGATNPAIPNLTANNYIVTVSDKNGCTNSAAINISEPTGILITTNNINNVNCFGSSNGSISVTVSGGVPSYIYSWSPNVGSTPGISNLIAGNYTLIVQDQNACIMTLSLSVTQPPPLTASTTSTLSPLCNGGNNGGASISTAGGTTPYQYIWSTFPVQTTASVTNLTKGSYTVYVSDENNCQDTVFVNLSEPAPVITLAGYRDTICLGQSVTISASASGGTGNFTYVWSPTLPGIGNTQTVSPITNTTYTITAYDQDNCAAQSDTIHIEVIDLAQGNTIVHATTPICPGESSAVYVVINGNPGPVTYSWNQGLGNTSGVYTVTPTQPTTYVVTITDLCGNIIKDSITVNFNPPPTIQIGTDTISGCVPLTINFSDLSVTGNSTDPIMAWFWTFGDGSTSTSQNPVHTYNATGTYTVTLMVTTEHGCTNSNTSAPLLVTVNPLPNALFAVSSTTLVLPVDTLKITNQSTGAVTYQWNFGDGTTSSQTDPVHDYDKPGTYRVQLIATNSFFCSDTTYIDVKADSDIKFPTAFTPDPNNEPDGYYDPNSLDNNVFFPYMSGVEEYHLMIFDRWGEMIFETNEVRQGWNGYFRHKICQQDVYIYKVYAKFSDGKIYRKTADVTLIR